MNIFAAAEERQQENIRSFFREQGLPPISSFDAEQLQNAIQLMLQLLGTGPSVHSQRGDGAQQELAHYRAEVNARIAVAASLSRQLAETREVRKSEEGYSELTSSEEYHAARKEGLELVEQLEKMTDG